LHPAGMSAEQCTLGKGDDKATLRCSQWLGKIGQKNCADLLKVRERSSDELCEPHVAISPAMLRSSNRRTALPC